MKKDVKRLVFKMRFPVLSVVLVLACILVLYIPFTSSVMSGERTRLASGLWEKADTLLGIMAASAELQIRLGADGFLSISEIPRFRTAMQDSISATITGPDPDGRPGDPKDFVWASDRQEFLDELARGEFTIARETVKDGLSGMTVAMQKRVDAEAARTYGSLIDEYRALQVRARDLRSRRDTGSRASLRGVVKELSRVTSELDVRSKRAFAQSATVEPFTAGRRLRSTYLFYKPIVFFSRAIQPADATFYQGMVRLEVSAEATNRLIEAATGAVLKMASLAAGLALFIGVLGSILIASIRVESAGSSAKAPPKK
jgi:hypothetical protein